MVHKIVLELFFSAWTGSEATLSRDLERGLYKFLLIDWLRTRVQNYNQGNRMSEWINNNNNNNVRLISIQTDNNDLYERLI